MSTSRTRRTVSRQERHPCNTPGASLSMKADDGESHLIAIKEGLESVSSHKNSNGQGSGKISRQERRPCNTPGASLSIKTDDGESHLITIKEERGSVSSNKNSEGQSSGKTNEYLKDPGRSAEG